MKNRKDRRPGAQLGGTLTVDGKEWSYAVDGLYVRVRSPGGRTTKLTRAAFHRFATVTPQDIKRFIKNKLKPVDYPAGCPREQWQKRHDGTTGDGNHWWRNDVAKEDSDEAEWKAKVESGEIFVDDEGEPLDPADALYPEHAKLARVKNESQAIGTFLDWLVNERGVFLCERTQRSLVGGIGDVWVPISRREGILSEYFEIDEAKLEQEKLAILEAHRKTHGKNKS